MTKKLNTIFGTLLLFTVSIVLYACSSKKEANVEKDKNPVVSVYDKTLYLSDLEKTVPEGLAASDSTQAAEAYIRMWINDELIYEKAKQNVADQEHINQMVEKYRQSLTVFTYLEQLLRIELSRKITDSQLKDFYDKYPETFKLEESLIKGLFLKVPQSSPELSNMKQWYKSNTSDAKESIEKTSIQNTVIYNYFYDRWVSLDDVISNIPVPIDKQNEFLRNNKNFETQDSSFVYLLHIEEYILAGSNAPYEYAKPSIKDILINQQRETFLKQFEEDLYKKAIDEDNIKYYIERKEDGNQ